MSDSIYQLPDSEPEEPTSTLVLTTSKNNYVDTRMLLPPDIRVTSVVPNSIPKPQLDLSHLDWAFAGTSCSKFRPRRSSSSSSKSGRAAASVKPLTPTDEKRESTSTHSRSASGGKLTMIRECTWTHWVDSRCAICKHTHADRRVSEGTQLPASPVTPEGFVDTGTIYPTADENETLEKGQLMNDKGVMQDMEELWRDFKPQRIPGESHVVSITLTAENKVFGTKGMVIRIGGWCQGIIRSSNGEIGVERWRYGTSGLLDGLVKRYDDSAAQQQHGKWQRIFKLGKMSLPCESACLKSFDLQEGESITQGGLKWSVIEKELF